MRRLFRILIPAVVLVTQGSSWSRAQIVNGSFESPVVSTQSILGLGITPGSQVFSAGTGITNWTVSGGNVSIVDSGSTVTSLLGLFTAAAGNQYAVLNGLNISVLGVVSQSGSAGTLSQSITTVAGKTYQISFEYNGFSLGLLSNNTALNIGVTNASGVTTPNGGVLSVNLGLGWQTETFQFTATGTSSVLSFAQNTSGVNIGLIALDNVNLTPLPEPAQDGAAAVLFLGLLIGGRIGTERIKRASLGNRNG